MYRINQKSSSRAEYDSLGTIDNNSRLLLIVGLCELITWHPFEEYMMDTYFLGARIFEIHAGHPANRSRVLRGMNA